nr:diadenylate cyclase CdaA [Calderihabitans maritimus]
MILLAAQLQFLKYLSLEDFILLLIDITLVSYVLYKLIILIEGTRAAQLLKGLAVLFIASFISEKLHLTTVSWILDQTRLMILVALPVVFQPELRRALEQLGRGRFFTSTTLLGAADMSRLINELIRAVEVLRKHKTGALIVIERGTGLNDYIENGVKVEGIVSAEFLVNIFTPLTPLHDGAVIIRGDRVMAAACFLPLTDSPYLSRQLGSRHRAALGITEISDAVAIVVSEETGTVSVAAEGQLTRYLEEKSLRELLEQLLLPKSQGFLLGKWRS